MGCNTSKDSAAVQPADHKEQKDNNENEAMKNGDSVVAKNNEEKPPSARTITIKSVSNSKPNSASPEGTTQEDETEPNQVEAAATKIQAAFRGHQSRKTMKQEDKSSSKTKSAQEQHQLKDELPSDDVELSHAATKIQASFRGHMVRKQIDKGDAHEQKQSNPMSAPDDLDIDLTDPELNKAATKIQASFRGHAVRKEHTGAEESAK